MQLKKDGKYRYSITVDSDILTIVPGQFQLIKQKNHNLNAERFGKGKGCMINDINETFINIKSQVTSSLLFFHALTGADTTSVFHRKTKLVEWKAWKSFRIVTVVTELFLWIMHNLFSIFGYKSSQFKIIERFIIVSYDRMNSHKTVTETPLEMFLSKKWKT